MLHSGDQIFQCGFHMTDISLTKICNVFPFEKKNKKLEVSEISRRGGEIEDILWKVQSNIGKSTHPKNQFHPLYVRTP